MDRDKAGKAYLRALAIRDGQARGRWVPIMQHLAFRQHADAMIELANWYCHHGDAGAASDGFGGKGLYRRAYRKGEARAAQHLAMDCFNRYDLAGYRLWLRRAARAGDYGSAQQLRHFETRLWHETARRIRRLRPEQKRDEFA